MHNGHSWSSIQDYTLAEIGTFLRVIIESEVEEKQDKLSKLWMGNNLTQKGLEQIVKAMGKKEEIQKNSTSEFKRLANFMSKQR